MVDKVSDIESGCTYRFIIKQSNTKYKADIEMDTMMDSTVGTAMGEVKSSTYPNDGWEGEHFRIHKDGTVQIPRDPFGPVGEVVGYKKL